MDEIGGCMKRRLVFMCLALWIMLPASPNNSIVPDTDRRFDSILKRIPFQDKELQAESYLELARLFTDSLPGQSFGYIRAAYNLAIQLQNNRIKAHARFLMGGLFVMKKEMLPAVANFLSALKLFEKTGDIDNQLMVLDAIGTLNLTQKNYAKAAEYFQRGLDLSESSGKQKATIRFLWDIAQNYRARKDFEKAELFYRKALNRAEKLQDHQGGVYIRNDLLSIYLDQERYKEVLGEYLNTLSLADPGDGFLLGVLYTRIAHIYSKTGDLRRSLEYNRKAYRIRAESKLNLSVGSSMINIANDFFSLGMPDSGWQYLNNGLRTAYRYHEKHLVENAYRHLFTYYSGKGDYRKGLEWFRKYMVVRDSILSEQTTYNILLIEANQKISMIDDSNTVLMKQGKLLALTLDNRKNHLRFVQVLATLLGLVMIILLILYFFNRRTKATLIAIHTRLFSERNDREKAQNLAIGRERQYRFLAENAMDFITVINKDKKRIYASPSSLHFYGYSPQEILDKTPYDLTHPDYHKYAERRLTEMAEKKAAASFIYRAIRKDGSEFWAESIINPVCDPVTGEMTEMVAVTRDIQKRKLHEFEIMEGTKQKENLLREIHHRVKNNFAVLISLINLQKDQDKNPEIAQALTNLQLRIRTMALVHEMLYRSGDFEKISVSDYVRSLANVISGTYKKDGVGLEFDLDEVSMDIDTSIPLGLIVNELLSNSFKHAFPGGKSGTIQIKLKVPSSGNNISFSVLDDGIGLPIGFNAETCPSMGFQVVRILTDQLEGTLIHRNNPGAEITIRFPLATLPVNHDR